MTDISREALTAIEQLELAYNMDDPDAVLDIDDLHHEVCALRDALDRAEVEKISLMDVRRWKFYPIEMPITKDGNGPATVGVDASEITYEVWDADTFLTTSTHKNLPDAINAAISMSFQKVEEAEGDTQALTIAYMKGKEEGRAQARRETLEEALEAVDEAGYYCIPPYDETGHLGEQLEHGLRAIRALIERDQNND